MIAIKDIDMPRTCGVCPFRTADVNWNLGCDICARLGKKNPYDMSVHKERSKYCPLVEVKDDSD